MRRPDRGGHKLSLALGESKARLNEEAEWGASIVSAHDLGLVGILRVS